MNKTKMDEFFSDVIENALNEGDAVEFLKDAYAIYALSLGAIGFDIFKRIEELEYLLSICEGRTQYENDLLRDELDKLQELAAVKKIEIKPKALPTKHTDCIEHALLWLKVALDCPQFLWDGDQHAAATFELNNALKELQAQVQGWRPITTAPAKTLHTLAVPRFNEGVLCGYKFIIGGLFDGKWVDAQGQEIPAPHYWIPFAPSSAKSPEAVEVAEPKEAVDRFRVQGRMNKDGDIFSTLEKNDLGEYVTFEDYRVLLAELNEYREPEVKQDVGVVQEFSDDEYICIRDAVDRLISAVGKDVDGDQSECSLISEFIDELIVDVINPLSIEWYNDDEGRGYMHSVNPRLQVAANKAEVPEGFVLCDKSIIPERVVAAGEKLLKKIGANSLNEHTLALAVHTEMLLSYDPLPPLKAGE